MMHFMHEFGDETYPITIRSSASRRYWQTVFTVKQCTTCGKCEFREIRADWIEEPIPAPTVTAEDQPKTKGAE